MQIRARHWLIAISAATLAHLLGVAASMRDEPQRPPPTPVSIQLGEAGAPEGTSSDSPAAAEAPLAPVAAAKPLPALAESETVKAEVVEPPQPEVTKPKPKPKPKQTKKPKPRTQATRPSAAPSSSAKPRAKDSSRTAGTRSGSGGRDSGKGTGFGAKGKANYYGKLAAWLNRHKRYPSRARRLRQEGTARVSFTLDRRGRVLSHRIVASSGHALLDQEVEAMIRRASPMPAFPAGMSQSRLSVTVPIRFNLR